MKGYNITLSRYLIFCFLGLSATGKSHSQSGAQMVFRKIDDQNGLSDNDVQCIYKDQRNFVWIGTASGLNLLDGSSLTVFTNETNNKNSISNNNIQAITEDRSGLLWIGTGEGLNIFDPRLNKFSIVPLPGFNNYQKDNIKSLAVDKKNNVFIGTSNGLFIYSATTKKISPIIFPGYGTDSIRNNNITRLALDTEDLLWISTYNGLWSYSEKSHKISHEISAENEPLFKPIFTCILIDHTGKLWTGIWDSVLIEFNPVTKKITNHLIPGIEKILSIAEIKQPGGNYIFWLNGIGIGFDPSANKVIHFSKPTGLPGFPDANTLYTSGDNWLWMGTAKGLYYYNPAKTLIKVTLFPSTTTGQSISIREWGKQLLVSGSDSSFLKSFDENLNIINNYSSGLSKKAISCLSLQQLSQNSFIAGTSKGIATIDLPANRIRLNPLTFLQNHKASGNFITFLFKDFKGNWWLFPWRNGIWTSDSDFKKFTQLFNNFLLENGKPKPLVIADAAEDADHNVWMADLDEGIIFYNRKTHTFSKPFEKELGSKYTCPQILYFRKYCYSFSGNKILKWNVDTVHLQIIDLPAQMDLPISSMAMDSSGRLWAATGKGLVVFDFTKNSNERFTTADGLVTNNMDGTLYCKKNGVMIFASPDYLLSFSPDQMLASLDKKPRLQFEGAIVNGKPILMDSSVTMKFNHNQNNFVFKWTVTDYNNPFNNHYYYLLQGVNKNWHDNGSHGQLNFANLSPGKYVLLFKGKNSNEIDTGSVLKYQFEILPPFWQTWWFLSLVGLSVLLIFYFFYRYRIQQALNLEKLRNKISLDLHDDIGSTLSSISILSEMAIRQNKEAATTAMLREIKENSISLMDKMDDIVWSINPENDSIENLFLRIKTFATRLFEAKEIAYRIEIENNLRKVKLPMQNRQNIYLVMKEAINNLVKYSDCTEAEINVGLMGDKLNITITDNGKGFDKKNIVSGNGIHSMNKRAKEMSANLEIKSVEGKGTMIILSLKIK